MPLIVLLATLASAAAAAPKDVSFKTSDGWTLAASYRPAAKGRPVAILAHGVAASKEEWARFAAALEKRGVGALAVDLRGHGGSRRGPAGERGYETFRSADWASALEDLRAAARWLEARGVPPARVGFAGASIGANLASRVSSERAAAAFLVMLSPGPDYQGVAPMLRANLRTLAAAAPPDAYAYQMLGALAEQGVETISAPKGHGVQMFDEPETFKEIADWMARGSKNP